MENKEKEELKIADKKSKYLCKDLDEDCPILENGCYSDGEPRSYERCYYTDPEQGVCPFLINKNSN